VDKLRGARGETVSGDLDVAVIESLSPEQLEQLERLKLEAFKLKKG